MAKAKSCRLQTTSKMALQNIFEYLPSELYKLKSRDARASLGGTPTDASAIFVVQWARLPSAIGVIFILF